MHVRTADFRVDSANIRRIRVEVFVEEQGVPEALELDDRDAACTHVLAFDDAGPWSARAGSTSTERSDGSPSERVRRSGVGLAMMDLLHRIARLRGLAEVWCQAQITQLTHFTDGRTIPDFAWPRDGKRLAVARMSFTSDILLVKGLRK